MMKRSLASTRFSLPFVLVAACSTPPAMTDTGVDAQLPDSETQTPDVATRDVVTDMGTVDVGMDMGTADIVQTDMVLLDSPMDVPPSCVEDAGLSLCGTQCVNLTNDREHCGICNRACASGEQCLSSVCTSVCTIQGVAVAQGTVNPMNPCERCDSARSTTDWSQAPAGTACGTGRVCNAGACVAGCFIEGSVRSPSTINPANDCLACNPATSTTAWTPLPDETACGTAQYCSGAACISTWHTSMPSGLTPMYGGATAAGLDGKIYLFGGATTSVTNISQVYTPSTDQFARIAVPPFAPYRSCAVTAPSGSIYIMGGSPNATPIATVAIYNPTTNTYTSGPAMPIALDEASCALGQDGKIYVFGSSPAVPVGSLYTTAHTLVLNPVNNVWSTAAPMPSPRQRTVAVRLRDGRIVVAGGNRGYIPGALSTLTEIYTPSTNTWTTAAAMPSSWHWNVGGLRADGRVVLAGGVSGTVTGGLHTFVYDPIANSWAEGLPTGDEHYAGYAATGTDGRVYVLTGRWQGTELIPSVDVQY